MRVVRSTVRSIVRSIDRRSRDRRGRRGRRGPHVGSARFASRPSRERSREYRLRRTIVASILVFGICPGNFAARQHRASGANTLVPPCARKVFRCEHCPSCRGFGFGPRVFFPDATAGGVVAVPVISRADDAQNRGGAPGRRRAAGDMCDATARDLLEWTFRAAGGRAANVFSESARRSCRFPLRR